MSVKETAVVMESHAYIWADWLWDVLIPAPCDCEMFISSFLEQDADVGKLKAQKQANDELGIHQKAPRVQSWMDHSLTIRHGLVCFI